MSALVAWVSHLPFCPRHWFKKFHFTFLQNSLIQTVYTQLFVDRTHDAPLSIWNAWIVRHVMNCFDMKTNNMMISYEDRMIMTLWWWGEEATKPSSSELNWAKNAMLVVNLFWKERAGILRLTLAYSGILWHNLVLTCFGGAVFLAIAHSISNSGFVFFTSIDVCHPLEGAGLLSDCAVWFSLLLCI